MPLVQDHLWSYIFWCPAKGPSFLAWSNLLGKAKVSLGVKHTASQRPLRLSPHSPGILPLDQPYHFHIAFMVQQQVLRLKVPVDNPLSMEVVKCLQNTANAEAGCGLLKETP